MTTEEMLILDKVATPAFREWMLTRPRPGRILGRAVPATLDDLTYGELAQLQMCGDSSLDAITCFCRVILGVEDIRKILRCDAEQMAGFIIWVTAEVERIGKLFASVQRQPTPEEVQAGIYNLKHDPFKTADWYARRMGITKHEEAMNTKWIYYFKCMETDNENDEFRRKLNKILSQKK